MPLLLPGLPEMKGQYLMLVSVSCFQMLTNGDVVVVEGTNGETPEKVVNGYATTLYPSRDRRSEAAMRGPLTSEREALLLGTVHIHLMYTTKHIHNIIWIVTFSPVIFI
ncbi:unnamed protein product [Oncorhynchus mykiss]|uniref:Uncharacterized protein n=1 Tax=Oncorhynchus mykiss TaxID=8022 RepID=A0A060Z0Z2_ONCMY|nr:unnamed protein product [Oncorhynchus mykiss]